MLLKEGKTALATFMLQQSVELCLRSLILAYTGMECKTHSVSVLKKHIARYAPELLSYLPGGSDEEERLLYILERAYLDGRYDDGFEVHPQHLGILATRSGLLLGASLLSFEDMMRL